MMKMSGRITSCCVALLLTFTTVSAVQRALRSINELDVDSRDLLRWFANKVCIGMNGDIQLTFDPNSGDYGSHHYGNFEGLLDHLPWGYRYYTLGNINQPTSLQVPSHRRNKARIIIRIREQNAGRQSQIIDQVYITQHYQGFNHERSEYDPDQTYEITTRLLREIRWSPMAIHDNTHTYRSNNFAYTSQLWGTENMQAAPRNEQRHFSANENSDPGWLVALVVLILLIGFLSFLFIANIK